MTSAVARYALRLDEAEHRLRVAAGYYGMDPAVAVDQARALHLASVLSLPEAMDRVRAQLASEWARRNLI